MATEHTQPTTLAGIKRLAKFIKRTQGTTHSDALDIAAEKAGFQNLRHAQSALNKSPSELHRAFITFYWMTRDLDPDNRLGYSGPILGSGCTTLEFLLPAALKDLLPGRTLERTPYLGAQYRLESPDHLELRRDCHNEQEGLNVAVLAGRVLNFMAVTGLRPLLANEKYGSPRNVKLSKKADHCSTWFDDESNSIITVDEPYNPQLGEAVAWARENDFYTVDVRWRGLYMTGYPPFLHSYSKSAISRIVERLEALEARLMCETWRYDRQDYEGHFTSPARRASLRRKAARIMPSPEGVERSGALPWGGEPGHQSHWRPARRMDLSKHLYIAPIINSIASATLSTHIGLIVSDLAVWFHYEYSNAEVPDEHDRYAYDLITYNFCPETESLLANLAIVRQTIMDGYDDCKPKGEMLARIDKAAASIRRNPLSEERKTWLLERYGTVSDTIQKEGQI